MPRNTTVPPYGRACVCRPPGGVEDAAGLGEPDELVGRGDEVNVASLAVVDEGVRLPQLVQRRDGQRDGRRVQTREGEALVHPRLPEVTVHGVGLFGGGRGEKG